MATLPVSRECMKSWGVGVKALWEAAKKNLEREVFQVETMEAVIENMLTEMKDSEDAGMLWNNMEGMEMEESGKMYVVTNLCRKYAARAILRKINHCSGTVEPKECLSDSVYHFNKNKDRVESVA